MPIHRMGMGANVSDVEGGKRFLSMFYGIIQKNKYPSPWKSLSEVIEYYSTDFELKAKGEPYSRWHHTDTLETFGYYLRTLTDQRKLMKALERVAKAVTATKAPKPQAFGDALVNQAKAIDMIFVSNVVSDIKKDVKEKAQTVANIAKIGVGGYVGLIVAASLLGVYSRFKGKQKVSRF